MWPPPGPTIPALPRLAAALGTTGNERGLNYGNYRNTRVFSQGLKNLTATVGLVKIHCIKASIAYPQCLCKWINIIDPWFATVNTVNYSQTEVGPRKKTASLFFYPTPMASKFVFLCGEVFFILVLRKTYLSQLQQCQQHQKQNMLHKFWAQKLMKTKNCHVFNISSIKRWFFFRI